MAFTSLVSFIISIFLLGLSKDIKFKNTNISYVLLGLAYGANGFRVFIQFLTACGTPDLETIGNIFYILFITFMWLGIRAYVHPKPFKRTFLALPALLIVWTIYAQAAGIPLPWIALPDHLAGGVIFALSGYHLWEIHRKNPSWDFTVLAWMMWLQGVSTLTYPFNRMSWWAPYGFATIAILGTSIGMGLMVGALREKQWQLLQEIGIRQEAETALRESEERYRIQFERASEGITVISGLNENLEQRVNERTAQLEAANREMEAFSYSVSHDLRAPLRSIDGLSQALLEDCQDQLDAAGRQYLSRIRLGTQRMGELIEDLLELSKTGRAELRRVEVELSGLARSVVDELARANPDSGVEVSIQPELRARADQHLIRVVLENLLGNAWKFTSKRRDPRIEFGGSVAPGGERIFFIRDNGAGFDMAHADRLFNAFQRLHLAADFEGTGIGLTIVQRIIHRHGGRIWAEAKPGEGASFFFTLPDPGGEA